jgi:hypothetical protein
LTSPGEFEKLAIGQFVIDRPIYNAPSHILCGKNDAFESKERKSVASLWSATPFRIVVAVVVLDGKTMWTA